MSVMHLQRKEYKVELVEETKAPQGMPGENWFRYIVGQGKDRIEGKRQGTLKAVTRHAEEFASELNSRGKRGGSLFKPKGTKDQKKTASQGK